jgi:hypothetical protein
MVAFELGLALLGVALIHLTAAPRLVFINDPIVDFSTSTVGLALFAPIGFALVHSNYRPIVDMRQLLERVTGDFIRRSNSLEFLALSMAAGLGEEILFRGWLQRRLEDSIGAAPSLCVASLAFGAAHAFTAAYFITATAIGLALGYLYLRNQGLFAPIVVHAGYDFITLMLFRAQLTRRRS